jgi:hypothetical protein
MTSFNIKVIFHASSPATAEAIFERLRGEIDVDGFSVPMSGNSYTIWLRSDADDPKVAFAGAIDAVHDAGGAEFVNIERMEIFSLEDASKQSGSRSRATA